MKRIATVTLRDNAILAWENADIVHTQPGVVTVMWRVADADEPHYVMIPLDTIKWAALDPMP